MKLLLREYNQEEEYEVIRQDAFDDGVEEGIERGIEQVAKVFYQ